MASSISSPAMVPALPAARALLWTSAPTRQVVFCQAAGPSAHSAQRTAWPRGAFRCHRGNDSQVLLWGPVPGGLGKRLVGIGGNGDSCGWCPFLLLFLARCTGPAGWTVESQQPFKGHKSSVEDVQCMGSES